MTQTEKSARKPERRHEEGTGSTSGKKDWARSDLFVYICVRTDNTELDLLVGYVLVSPVPLSAPKRPTFPTLPLSPQEVLSDIYRGGEQILFHPVLAH